MKKEKPAPAQAQAQAKSKIREFIESILLAVIIAAFIISFIVQAFKIPSGSMIPTLVVGDHLFVNKFIYGVKLPYFRNTIIPVTEPKKGDVIVFIYPHDRSLDYIKRVVGTAGDTIEMKNKQLLVNNQPMPNDPGVYDDPVVFPANVQPRDNFAPITVPKGSVFVMGDNRDHSMDSRFWGFVDLKDVLGKAFIIYWSWDTEDKTVRWSRLVNLIR